MNRHNYTSSPPLIITIPLLIVLLYSAAAWMTFQARNPKANNMTFWTEFPAVMTWKELPRFQ